MKWICMCCFLEKLNKLQNFINFITNLKQINNKRTLVNLYKDIVLSGPSTPFLYDVVYKQPLKMMNQIHAIQIYHICFLLTGKGFGVNLICVIFLLLHIFVVIHWILGGVELKRFYTRGTLRSIMLSRLTKIPTLYRNLAEMLELRKGLFFWVA